MYFFFCILYIHENLIIVEKRSGLIHAPEYVCKLHMKKTHDWPYITELAQITALLHLERSVMLNQLSFITFTALYQTLSLRAS